MSTSGTSKTIRYMRLIAANFVILGFLLLVIEGLASYVFVARKLLTAYSVAERRHTQYDPDLGWINAPSVNLSNMYGPGVYLRTNSQRFRNSRDFDRLVPKGKNRIICSGDSFTLGYGVDNDHTWCQLLTFLDPRLEAVNMGQGGYGVDQAYLWYKRDAAPFDHRMHFLALTTWDFQRMQKDNLLGYGKPVIRIENGELLVKNVPVPKRPYVFPWLTANTENFKRLRTVELLREVSSRTRSSLGNTDLASETKADAETREVLRKIFQELKRLNEERSSKLVLVYLPTLGEIKRREYQVWMKVAGMEARSLGIASIDLLSKFEWLSSEDSEKMFIMEGQVNYPGAAGHLNNEGNERVARAIYHELKSQSALSRVLSLE